LKFAVFLPLFVCTFITAAAKPASTDQQVTVTARIEVASKPGTPPAAASDAVVWLTALDYPAEPQISPARRTLQLVQKHKTFLPHLLVVPVGSTVEFPNRDPFFHNVFSLFEGKRFDLGLYEAGSTRTVVFNRIGISYIFCNIHPEMSAVVVALKSPYYAVSDIKGAIAIPNVPVGRYELQVWHERVLPDTLNALQRTVAISEGSSSLGVIHLPEERSLLKDHKNKYGQEYDSPTPATPGYTRP
jgi:plastocyanin